MRKAMVAFSLFALVMAMGFAEVAGLPLDGAAQTPAASPAANPFAGIDGIPIADSELALTVGGWTHINAPYDSAGDFEVEQRSDCYVERYTVRGTINAAIIRNVPTWEGVSYGPVPLPSGTFQISTELTHGSLISGYHIDVNVPTVLSNGRQVAMNDYFVHATSYPNTWGCAGVQTDWDRVSQTISRETDHAWISVGGRRGREW